MKIALHPSAIFHLTAPLTATVKSEEMEKREIQFSQLCGSTGEIQPARLQIPFQQCFHLIMKPPYQALPAPCAVPSQCSRARDVPAVS